MAENIDDITINYEDEGQQTVKELDKQVLTRGAWSTIVFKYQDWDRSKEAFGPIRYSIRRYQKRNGEFSQRSKFNISSAAQAKQLIEVLENWMKADEEQA